MDGEMVTKPVNGGEPTVVIQESKEPKALPSPRRRGSVTAQQRRIVHASAPEKNAPSGRRKFPNNRISNSKYTWYSFLPKVLLEQFSLHMNRYFLLIAILQLFPQLSPVSPLTTWGPLVVIFGVSAVKEFFDDRERKRQDRVANETVYCVYRDGAEKLIQAQHIEVGDIVRLAEDEDVPCDLVLLASSNDGQCFIQTTNLDGESNLKDRAAVPETRALSKDEIITFKGVVECPAPNKDIYGFDARLWLKPALGFGTPDSQPIALKGDQLLQQATRLRNTELIYGLAVYTGNETKFGKNKGPPKLKLTRADNFVNTLAIWLFIWQFSLVIVFGIYGEHYRRSTGKSWWYLRFDKEDPLEFLYIPLRFLLLNSTFIPISLKITLDLSKLYYARFINNDMNMWDPKEGPARANNTSISEDLGQIEYVLTDKTGTLTQNNMVFKQCTVGAELYSQFHCAPGGLLTQLIRGGKQAETDFLRNFALNNSIIPVHNKNDSGIAYKGSSPDEVALVRAARENGIRLVARDRNRLRLEVSGASAAGKTEITEEKYTVLQELEFTSERKRMSAIIRNEDTGRIRMYTKGADDVLLAKLRTDQKEAAQITLQHLNEFGREGLRTLVYACRDISDEEFKAWTQEFERAQTAMDGRKEKVAAAFDLIEKDLVLQGSSAIEDRLQDKVPETIELLRMASVKFWMLTGDKYSTALQVATACNLKSADQRTKLAVVEGKDAKSIGECIDDLKRVHVREDIMIEGHEREWQGGAELVVVVHGGMILDTALAFHRDNLLQLLLAAHAVICCRVTPAQKAELVKLVKSAGKMTLAIGDGGNDVGMIQEAHIGVGIRGKEGLQAARAADYTVAYFKHLKNLMMIHGRYSYIRTALIAQYSFYKSFFFCCMQIAYGFVSSFAGSTLFNSLCITSYNALLFIPIVSFVLHKDVPFETVLANPALYAECAQGKQFNARTFFLWVLRAILQAIAVFIITVLSWGPDFVTGKGQPADWETLGILAFLGFLWIQSLTMTLELSAIAWWNIILIWGFHALTFIILIATNFIMSFDSLNGFGIVNVALAQPSLWIVNILMVVTAIMPVIGIKFYQTNYDPEPSDHLRYLVQMAKGLGSVDFSKVRARNSTENRGVELAVLDPPLSPVSANADKKPLPVPTSSSDANQV